MWRILISQWTPTPTSTEDLYYKQAQKCGGFNQLSGSLHPHLMKIYPINRHKNVAGLISQCIPTPTSNEDLYYKQAQRCGGF